MRPELSHDNIFLQVAGELERSLPHGVRAFERVSRAIQRLCNGYTSLPGLLEWGRLNAARLEGHGTGGNGAGSLGDGTNGAAAAHGLQTSICSDGGGDGDGGGSGSDWRHSFPKRGATAAPGGGGGGGGGRYTERWVKGDRARSGRGSAESGTAVVEEMSPSSAFAVTSGGSGGGATSCSSSCSRLPEDRRGGGGGREGAAWSSSLTASLSSASAASLPERAPLAPSRHPDSADVYYLPRMVRGAGRDLGAGGAGGGARRRLKTAGDIGGGGGSNSGSGSGGILCAADYGESMAGSTWEGGETMAALMCDGGDLSSLGATHHQGGAMSSASSVASLLREERAFQRRSNTLQW